MAKLNKVRFLLLVSLMISPAYALDVIISGAHHNFKQRSEIKTNIVNGEKLYCGTLNPLAYEAGVNISNVIVYIIDRSRYVEIIRNAVGGARLQIAEDLKQSNYELVFLGIENFDDDEHHLIGAFILEKIQPHSNQIDRVLTIQVIGESRFDRSYQCHFVHFRRYRENYRICGGTLVAHLRAIPRGALRPVESNANKFIKLLEFLPPDYTAVAESMWSVSVINNTYCPVSAVNALEYNFRFHPNKKFFLLVLDRKEYTAVTGPGNSLKKKALRKILKRMGKDDELLYIMGVFNFDWYDVYLVTQIILAHTEVLLGSDYNVFACGFGMFDTYYLNWHENDGRVIQEPNYNVLKIREALLGEVEERAINMRCFHNGWQKEKIPINLGNGQYVPVGIFTTFTFPWLNQSIAFIVCDSAEMNDPIDDQTVQRAAEEMRQSNIYVVVIEAMNFELHDMHIIAEWIEEHRGQIDPEQIAVLGAGTFDIIFQSQRNTYNKFFNIRKNELKAIRNAFVESGNEKSILIANIDNKNFKAWSYPMNTVVNGFYEPDLIPEKNMLDTTDGRKILFIITSAHNFQQIAGIENVGRFASSFRESINDQCPIQKWSVFLVALHNFRERDCYLFAEFVKMQMHNKRALAKFVRVFNYGIKDVEYRYKDTPPFIVDSQAEIYANFTYVFGRECSLLDDTRSD